MSPGLRLWAIAGLLGVGAACLRQHGDRHLWLSPAPELAASAHPAAQAGPVPPTVSVIYVTDRAPLPDGALDRAYGWARGDAVQVGEAEITFGEEQTAEDLYARTTTPGVARRWPVRTTAVEVRGSRADGASAGEAGVLPTLVRERIEAGGTADVFLTIHGIATGFGASLQPAAELWHHLGRRGVPIAYSWPTGMGGWVANAYGYERESGEFTVPHLMHTLRALAAMPEVRRIHLIAHSMGNTVLLDTLRLLKLTLAAQGVDAQATMKLGTVVLAAPDIGADVFRNRVVEEGITTLPERMVLYVSDRDKALSASSWMHGGRRIGTSTAVQLTHFALDDPQGGQVEIVDCAADRRGGSHDYYLTNPAVLADVVQVLDDASAGQGRQDVSGAGR